MEAVDLQPGDAVVTPCGRGVVFEVRDDGTVAVEIEWSYLIEFQAREVRRVQ